MDEDSEMVVVRVVGRLIEGGVVLNRDTELLEQGEEVAEDDFGLTFSDGLLYRQRKREQQEREIQGARSSQNAPDSRLGRMHPRGEPDVGIA